MFDSFNDPNESDRVGRGYTSGTGAGISRGYGRTASPIEPLTSGDTSPSGRAKSSSDLLGAEKSADNNDGQSAISMPKEKSLFTGKMPGDAKNGLAPPTGPAAKGMKSPGAGKGGLSNVWMKISARQNRNMGLMTVITAVTFLLISFFSSTLMLHNISKNWSNNSLGPITFSRGLRRAKIAVRIAKGVGRESTKNIFSEADRLDSPRLTQGLEEAGFTLERDATTGAVTKISKGENLLVDYTNVTISTEKQLAASLSGKAGREAAEGLNKVWNTEGAIIRGEGGREVLRLIKARFGGFGESIAKSDATLSERASAEIEAGMQPVSEEPAATKFGQNPNFDNEQATTDAAGKKTAAADIADATKVGDGVTDEAIKASTVLEENANKLLGPVAEQAAKGAAVESIFTTLVANAGKVGFKGALTAAGSAVDPVLLAATVCQVKGTLLWLSSVRNLRMSIELGRLAVKWLGTAAEQDAGTATSQAINTFISGQMNIGGEKGYATNSGGLLKAMNPGSTYHASTAGTTQFTTGRGNGGIYETISDIIDMVPIKSLVVNSTCKIVTNGWVQLGTFVVGAVVAVLTVGGSPASATAAGVPLWSAGIQVLGLLATEIGGPFLAKTGKHILFNDVKGNLFGEAGGSALGSHAQQLESHSYGVLAPKTVTTLLRQTTRDQQKLALSKQSFTERYFSTDNPNSLLMKTAAVMPIGLPGITSDATTGFANTLSSISDGSFLTSAFGGRAAAADESRCNDPAVVNAPFPLDSDDFCNLYPIAMPDLNLEQTTQSLWANGQIDAQGKPIGENILNYKKRCVDSPTPLHNATPDKDGSDSDLVTDCTDNTPLAGETQGALDAYAYIMPDKNQKQSWFARNFGTQKAYADAATTDLSRLVSARESYAYYLGVQQEAKDFANEVNGYPNDKTTPATLATSPTTSAPSTPTDTGAGVNIPGQNTDKMSCPVSSTIKDMGVNPLGKAYLGGTSYDIRLCGVQGVNINAIAAKRFDDLFTAMGAAGFNVKGTFGFRDMAGQISGYSEGRGSGTFAKPGYSNHQFGTAADIVCSGAGGSGKYTAGNGRGRDTFLAGVSAYPCLDWVHKNSVNYGLLLQCDGTGAGGGEIRASSGGCEWWHLSPTGG